MITIAVLAMLALGLPSLVRAAQDDPAAPSTRPPAGERPQVEDVAAAVETNLRR
jgi:hypothetical protein